MEPITTRLSFIGEWYQDEAGMIRTFLIQFYPNENYIEIFDQRTKKVFLRRTRIDALNESDFFIGGKVNIFGRKIDLLDFGDETTKSRLESVRKRSFLLVKPDGLKHLGSILSMVLKNGFTLKNARMVQFEKRDAQKFSNGCSEQDTNASASSVAHLLTGVVAGFELMGDNCVEKLKKLIGPTDPIEAEKDFPNSIRALYGTDLIRNAVHCPNSEETTLKELKYFFNGKHWPPTASFKNDSTLCIIKPHTIKEGKAGEVIFDILENDFSITAMRMFSLERSQAEEFLEVYKGILPEYIQMVTQLSSGLCLAMEIKSSDSRVDSHAEFRKFCGPLDPEIAIKLRPNTLRAKYGISKVLNAIHCTDLPDDTMLEIEYFFKILE